ncbi:MAG: sigma54 specific transcriptional regulator, Fis family [Clostridiales bacterium]|nr:sigma54 specific transcriptional regulator, Fis family [Clostridiales bacterium]
MKKISFIVPKKSMVDLVFKTYQEHSEQYKETADDKTEYSLSVYVAGTTKEVSPNALEADILIARGLIVKELKVKYPNAAIVEVPISGSEMVSAIHKGLGKDEKQPIAVIGSFNMVYSAHGMDEILGVDIKSYLQESHDTLEIKKIVDAAIADNRRIIISGSKVYNYAITCGCRCVFLGMSKESIWQAISEAKHGAVIRRKEREKAVQFKTILDYAYVGIIATDRENRISVFNTVAENILGIPAKLAIGSRADEVLPRSKFSSLLQSSKYYNNEIIPFGNYHLSVNKVAMNLGKDSIGNIITFQESSSIQQMESKLRNKIYSRGHISHYDFDDITGESPALINAIEKAKNYAGVNSNILIIGETGTGKELFAQSIHNASERKKGPFVAINCAALSKSLLESELFGYVEGAFTGAAKGGKPGLFELAHNGTIFLDEISEIPVDLQGRLLRVIQEREIMRLGHDRIIPINVRIISATNKPLLSQVENNEFRRDLYYRLNVLTLKLPSLKERGSDILLIANKFIQEYCDSFHKPFISLSQKACDRLLKHRWQGNIRELRNICECLTVLDKTGVITELDIDMVLDDMLNRNQSTISCNDIDLKSFERENIINVLKNCNNDKYAAAKILGISNSTLWRRFKDLKINYKSL